MAKQDGTAVAEAKPLLTPREFHAALGGSIGLNSIYHVEGLKRIRVGRKVLIPASEVTDFITRQAK